MKKAILYPVLLILLAAFVFASVDAEYTCADERCKEGTPINFTVIIENNIDKKIDIGYVSVIEPESKYELVKEEVEIRLQPGEITEVTLEGEVIAPVEGYTYYYQPCFYVIVSNESAITEGGMVCREATKSISVLPLSKIECYEDWECVEGEEYCDTEFFKCRKLDGSTEEDDTIIVQPDYEETTFEKVKYAIILVIVIAAVVFLSYYLIFKDEEDDEKKGKKKN